MKLTCIKEILTNIPCYPHDGNKTIEWLCLVNKSLVEAEWLIAARNSPPPTHWWFYVVYVRDQIVALSETRRGQLGGYGEYWMGRLRVI
jgi:hypothetical protein